MFLEIISSCLKIKKIKRITFRNCIFQCEIFLILKDIFYQPCPWGLTFDFRGNAIHFPEE